VYPQIVCPDGQLPFVTSASASDMFNIQVTCVNSGKPVFSCNELNPRRVVMEAPREVAPGVWRTNQYCQQDLLTDAARDPNAPYYALGVAGLLFLAAYAFWSPPKTQFGAAVL
jgi:hypothetical protein